MILPRGFYYEGEHPYHGNLAYFIVRPVPASIRRATEVPGLNWGCLTNLHVAPVLRGKGVGRELLRLLIGWQDAMRVNIVFRAAPYAGCKVTDWDRLRAFYRSAGFAALAPASDYRFRYCSWHRHAATNSKRR